MVLAQARMETRLLLRNGEQLLLAVVDPADRAGRRDHRRRALRPDASRTAPVDTLTPGVLALAVMSTSFTSLAIATGFERRYGVLKRLGASPLPRVRPAGRQGRRAAASSRCCSSCVIGGAAALLGWSPALTAAGLLGALACALLGTAAFASLGLFVAGALRAEATLAAANLVYLLLLAGGAVVFPADVLRPRRATSLALLPSGALGDGMRDRVPRRRLPRRDPCSCWPAGPPSAPSLTARTFTWE